MTDQEHNHYENFKYDALAKCTEKLSQQEQDDRLKHMEQLQKLHQEYNMHNFREEILDTIDKTRDDSELIAEEPLKIYGDVSDLLDRMTNQHRNGRNAVQQDVIDQVFENYSIKLADLENKDI